MRVVGGGGTADRIGDVVERIVAHQLLGAPPEVEAGQERRRAARRAPARRRRRARRTSSFGVNVRPKASGTADHDLAQVLAGQREHQVGLAGSSATEMRRLWWARRSWPRARRRRRRPRGPPAGRRRACRPSGRARRRRGRARPDARKTSSIGDRHMLAVQTQRMSMGRSVVTAPSRRHRPPPARVATAAPIPVRVGGHGDHPRPPPPGARRRRPDHRPHRARRRAP